MGGRRSRSCRPDPRPREDRWAGAHPLHDQPPDGHERRAYRRAWRGREAHALSPPSGAVGQQPRPQGDEPKPHRRNLSRDSRQDARGAARYRFVRRLHRRLPRRDREGFRGDAEIVDAVRYASAYSFKYSARPGTPAATMEDQIPREIMDDRLQRLQARIDAHQLAFNRSKGGCRHANPGRAQGQARGPDDRPIAVAPVGPRRNRREARRYPRRDAWSPPDRTA